MDAYRRADKRASYPSTHSPCPSTGALFRSIRRSRNRKRHTCRPARARSCKRSPPCALSPSAGRCRSPCSARFRWNSPRSSALHTAAPTGIIKRSYRSFTRIPYKLSFAILPLSLPFLCLHSRPSPSIFPPILLSRILFAKLSYAGSIDMVGDKVGAQR